MNKCALCETQTDDPFNDDWVPSYVNAEGEELIEHVCPECAASKLFFSFDTGLFYLKP